MLLFFLLCCKKRKELVEYFSKVREGLKDDGVIFSRYFGGTETRQELVEETEHEAHSYFWDCDQFNPLTNECQYYIHFKVDNTKYEKAFSYDWRMWTIPEIKEILVDAGFSNSPTGKVRTRMEMEMVIFISPQERIIVSLG